MIDLITRAFVGSKLQQRRNDLLADGYGIMFERFDEIGAFCKLRHRNGTIIILTCDYGAGTITQKTNGEVVHFEKVC